jgi:hypothetical protein
MTAGRKGSAFAMIIGMGGCLYLIYSFQVRRFSGRGNQIKVNNKNEATDLEKEYEVKMRMGYFLLFIFFDSSI